MAEQAEIKQHIDALMATVQPMSGYKDTFVSHCKEMGSRISTGILSFDKALNGGLANELYIMGAETSTGKSAFLMSIAQKVAESGTDVLYFALEMGRDEFVARGISAISFEHFLKDSKERRLTAGNILYWTYDKDLNDFSKMAYSTYEKYSDEYFERYGEHLHIIESGMSGLTVKEIANIAALYKKSHPGQSLAVFVDYLQIIKPDPEDRSQSDRKTKTDIVVTTLKTLASQVGMPVITISSVGRAGYGSTISSASMKESGDLEFTAGVLLGWNWHHVTDERDTEKQQKAKEYCKTHGSREMILDVLKYRNSERDQRICIRYYPAYNYFEEAEADWDTYESAMKA